MYFSLGKALPFEKLFMQTVDVLLILHILCNSRNKNTYVYFFK